MKLLKVSLNNLAVGTITLLPNGGIFFAFDEDYVHYPQKSVLSQSFFTSSGELIQTSKITSTKLPPFFSNLLPEGHMREYLAQRGNIKPTQEFKLIKLLGEDLPGAVIVTPLADVSDMAHLHHLSSDDDRKPYHFSLAGIQLKFSAIAERHGGLTIPTSGVGGDWIIKLPAQNYAYVPENEFAMMQLASRIGIVIPEIKLVPLDMIGGLPEMGILLGKQALAVKRFDRGEGGERIHIEDFAQVYNIYPDKKYQGVSFANIAGMIWTLTGEAGLTDFIRRLTFTVLIGNGDMHLKNWSFVYDDGITPSLSPAYDMVSTIPYIPQDTLALNLGDTKDMRLINIEHFKKLAKKAQVPEHLVLQTVRDTVEATFGAWADHRQHDDMPDEIRDCIEKHMSTVQLGRR